VKFNSRHEYEYVQNFKVLQSVFDKHKIDNHIPVERLIKSKVFFHASDL
jgi:RP/EB family microtubule-associated protein